LNGEKYYLLSSKRHFPLFFFQCVTRPRKEGKLAGDPDY